MEVSAAHHPCTETLWTTLQLLSSLMGSLGGESSGLMGIRIPGWAPTLRFYHVGCNKCCWILSRLRQQEAKCRSWQLVVDSAESDSCQETENSEPLGLQGRVSLNANRLPRSI